MLWYQSIPLWLQKWLPSLIWQKPIQDQKIVYLTFDDGPHPDITPWVLETLKSKGCKATFFCVGDNVRKHAETYRQVIDDGHQIGNHTMHHIKGWSNSTEAYCQNISQAAEYIDSKLFRPPYGRISKGQIKALKDSYQIVMWNLLSCDFNPHLNVAKALDNLKRKTQSGSIIVFHDSIKAAPQLKQLLPAYIDFLIYNGYSCQKL